MKTEQKQTKKAPTDSMVKCKKSYKNVRLEIGKQLLLREGDTDVLTERSVPRMKKRGP